MSALSLLAFAAQDASSGEDNSGRRLSPIQFQNVADQADLDFVLENYATPNKHYIETMPGGVAAFDYNGDGLTDIFFTNGAVIPSLRKEGPRYFNRLYRNLGGMRFEDVTGKAGLQGEGYSMGVAAADFDNDGHVDLFVAGVFRNILYRNNGDGTFIEVTEKAGIKSDLWAVAAGWFDYDNDGWLDLFVVNYVAWSVDDDRWCGDRNHDIRVYCHPRYYAPVPNSLYRNRGDGTFEDISEKAGISAHLGKGMSVAFADYDEDGWIDAFVTNDKVPNFMFRNRGDGTFEEVGLLSGTALPSHGKPVSSMGVDFRDYDNDGRPDLNVTALTGETFPLFRNEGGGFFKDATYTSRIGTLSFRRSGWGNGFFDFDNDGWKDLFTANAHVDDMIHHFESTTYEQPNSVFANAGDGTFRDVSEQIEGDFQTPRAHRGSAFADFNQDGRMDVVVTVLGGPPELWENTSPVDHNWIIVRLEGTTSNRDGIGTRIRADDQYNLMTSAVGYASSSHFGVHFGLGKKKEIGELEIHWPSGKTQVLRNVPANQILLIREP